MGGLKLNSTNFSLDTQNSQRQVELPENNPAKLSEDLQQALKIPKSLNLDNLSTEQRKELITKYREHLKNKYEQDEAAKGLVSRVRDILMQSLAESPKIAEAVMNIFGVLGGYLVGFVYGASTLQNPITTAVDSGAAVINYNRQLFNEKLPRLVENIAKNLGYEIKLRGFSAFGENQTFSKMGDWSAAMAVNPLSHIGNVFLEPGFATVELMYDESSRGLYNYYGKTNISYSDFKQLQSTDPVLKWSKNIFYLGEAAAGIALIIATGGGASSSSAHKLKHVGKMLGISFGMSGVSATANELLDPEEFKFERFLDTLISGTSHSLLFMGGLSAISKGYISTRYGSLPQTAEDASRLRIISPDNYLRLEKVLKESKTLTGTIDFIDGHSDLADAVTTLDRVQSFKNYDQLAGALMLIAVSAYDVADYERATSDTKAKVSPFLPNYHPELPEIKGQELVLENNDKTIKGKFSGNSQVFYVENKEQLRELYVTIEESGVSKQRRDVNAFIDPRTKQIFAVTPSEFNPRRSDFETRQEYLASSATKRQARLIQVSELVHEVAHAKGKSEIEAREDQAKYLAKNGYQIIRTKQGFSAEISNSPILPEPEMFSSYINSNYSDQSVLQASQGFDEAESGKEKSKRAKEDLSNLLSALEKVDFHLIQGALGAYTDIGILRAVIRNIEVRKSAYQAYEQFLSSRKFQEASLLGFSFQLNKQRCIKIEEGVLLNYLRQSEDNKALDFIFNAKRESIRFYEAVNYLFNGELDKFLEIAEEDRELATRAFDNTVYWFFRSGRSNEILRLFTNLTISPFAFNETILNAADDIIIYDNNWALALNIYEMFEKAFPDFYCDLIKAAFNNNKDEISSIQNKLSPEDFNIITMAVLPQLLYCGRYEEALHLATLKDGETRNEVLNETERTKLLLLFFGNKIKSGKIQRISDLILSGYDLKISFFAMQTILIELVNILYQQDYGHESYYLINKTQQEYEEKFSHEVDFDVVEPSPFPEVYQRPYEELRAIIENQDLTFEIRTAADSLAIALENLDTPRIIKEYQAIPETARAVVMKYVRVKTAARMLVSKLITAKGDIENYLKIAPLFEEYQDTTFLRVLTLMQTGTAEEVFTSGLELAAEKSNLESLIDATLREQTKEETIIERTLIVFIKAKLKNPTAENKLAIKKLIEVIPFMAINYLEACEEFLHTSISENNLEHALSVLSEVGFISENDAELGIQLRALNFDVVSSLQKLGGNFSSAYVKHFLLRFVALDMLNNEEVEKIDDVMAAAKVTLLRINDLRELQRLSKDMKYELTELYFNFIYPHTLVDPGYLTLKEKKEFKAAREQPYKDLNKKRLESEFAKYLVCGDISEAIKIFPFAYTDKVLAGNLEILRLLRNGKFKEIKKYCEENKLDQDFVNRIVLIYLQGLIYNKNFAQARSLKEDFGKPNYDTSFHICVEAFSAIKNLPEISSTLVSDIKSILDIFNIDFNMVWNEIIELSIYCIDRGRFDIAAQIREEFIVKPNISKTEYLPTLLEQFLDPQLNISSKGIDEIAIRNFIELFQLTLDDLGLSGGG